MQLALINYYVIIILSNEFQVQNIISQSLIFKSWVSVLYLPHLLPVQSSSVR